MLHTTLRIAKANDACKESYVAVKQALGKGWGLDDPIPLTRILELRGLDDALWCLVAVLPEEETARDKLAHLLACDYAERVLGLFETAYPDDKRPRQAIETARLYANGQATTDALAAARAAAWAAARDAARAAERKWQGRRLMKYLEAVR